MLNFLLLLFIIRGCLAFIFLPVLIYFFSGNELISIIEFDLFIKRGFLPLSQSAFKLCSIFFLATTFFVYIFTFITKKINFISYTKYKFSDHGLTETAYILFIVILLAKIRFFFIPEFFEVSDRDDLIFTNSVLFIISQFFFPSIPLFVPFSLLIMKVNKTKFDNFIINLFFCAFYFASFNLQSRLFLLIISVMLVIYIFNNGNKKIFLKYKTLISLIILSFSFLTVFINADLTIVHNLFNNFYEFSIKDFSHVFGDLIKYIFNLIYRLDIYHIVNSWIEMGIKYGDLSNNEWARSVMIIHDHDLRTKVGLPIFIKFLPTNIFYYDFLIILLFAFLVAMIFYLTYLSSINLGLVFCVATMTFFCLSWPDKRIEPMVSTVIEIIFFVLFSISYDYIRKRFPKLSKIFKKIIIKS